jgi:hypothetical protein
MTKDAKHMIKIQEQKKKKFIEHHEKDIKDRIYDFIVKEALNLQKDRPSQFRTSRKIDSS